MGIKFKRFSRRELRTRDKIPLKIAYLKDKKKKKHKKEKREVKVDDE